MDTTVETFEKDVIEASHKVPVLLDIWAPWCGPCKTLGPILERLETQYAGRFKLVKVNSDEQGEISAALQVRSIPYVVAFVDGRPVDKFVGALPEGQIRAFIDKLMPKPSHEALSKARAALSEGNRDIAEYHLKAALAIDPSFDEARFDYCNLLLDMGQEDAAKQQMELISPRNRQDPRHAALLTRLNAVKRAADLPGTADLLSAIEANPADLQTRLDLANLLISRQAFEPALEQLLEIVARDRKFGDDVGRKTMISVFEMAASQPTLVSAWRRKLSTALN